jgi:Leu/Phe-tRNA-protein transferase
MLATDYDEEFCLAVNPGSVNLGSMDFDPAFIAALMKAGFLVMSADFDDEYVLLPKLHLERSVLLFPELHIKKSLRRYLSRYELRVDGIPATDFSPPDLTNHGSMDMETLFYLEPGASSDFEYIMERCVEVHDDAWLTSPLCHALREIRAMPALPVRPLSFGVYRDGILRAGEFGVLSGRVYTSYSGYYDEDNAGAVQMVLTAKYLESLGAPFWDLGMPLEYKDALGARNIGPLQFVELFRNGQR